MVSSDLGFAKPLVQALVDSGWTVQPVRPSKLNGFLRATKKAAWIDTDKGILEVIYFQDDAEVNQIKINEEPSTVPTYHKYVLHTPTETQRMEGGAAYFTKHGNMLIVTSDARLNEFLKRVLTSS